MNRLKTELTRLYLAPAPTGSEPAGPQALADVSGRVRALVMELAHPPTWEVLSRVWHGVQTELGLPAPAIAISGIDALQLWFAVEKPIEVARAHGFLAGLQRRFLADIDPARIRLLPAMGTSLPGQVCHARLVPALQAETGNWSAFLAPDLVAVFADAPWLDLPPNEEGQALLLQGLAVMEQAQFDATFEKLVPGAHPTQAVATAAGGPGGAPAGRPPDTVADSADPRQFLLQVMADGSVPLALRIEAAKALLPHDNDLHPPRGT